jgi:hypothetical protein
MRPAHALIRYLDVRLTFVAPTFRCYHPIVCRRLAPVAFEDFPMTRTTKTAPKPGRETLKKSDRAPRIAVNAVTGAPVELKSLHGPVRTVDGDPEKAARRAARASVVQLRTTRQAKAAPAAPEKPVERPAMRAGAKRTAASTAPAIAALRSPEGATLAECTKLAQWDAPFELRNLKIAAAKRNATISHTGEGEARRYRLVGGRADHEQCSDLSPR